MNQVITTEKVPIKMWLDDIEDNALEQAKNLANLPFVHKWVSLMPDCHTGYGMPIGGVLATKGVIIPNAVGVDIGCGMRAMKTSLTDIDKGDLQEIVEVIRDTIPMGFKSYDTPRKTDMFEYASEIIRSNIDLYKSQLGTLGGGNHFIEIQKGSDGHIWVMLHSGSRKLGHAIATSYHKLSVCKCEKWYSCIPDKELSFFPINSSTGMDYRDDMEFAITYACHNRYDMMNIIKGIFADTVDYNVLEEHDVKHNYAAMENHFGSNVMVHRKGAIRVRKGEIGIIPGSQGSKSYMVEGKGNPDSFMSCSHGAGRKMGRKQAQKNLNLAEEQKILNDQGIIHGITDESNLDEATGAYKDISTVMSNQYDLVDIKVELTPLAVIKA